MSDSASNSASESIKPGLMGEYTDEELNEHTIKHAKYFTVVQVNRGGFVRGGTNYDRHQEPTLEAARIKAAELYALDKMRGILIYAVADFAGANGFSRPVESYPNKSYQTKADKARQEKLDKKAARDRIREARLNLGSKKPAKIETAPALPVDNTVAVGLPEGFEDAAEALFFVTED